MPCVKSVATWGEQSLFGTTEFFAANIHELSHVLCAGL
jgi:hypothetical protein